jgi:hypothetical protein
MSALTHPNFPLRLNDTERQAGFEVARVANPDAHQPGASAEVYAMVRTVDANNRVLKIQAPDGAPQYLHRQREVGSMHGSPATAQWKTVSPPLSDVEAALRAASNGTNPNGRLHAPSIAVSDHTGGPHDRGPRHRGLEPGADQ